MDIVSLDDLEDLARRRMAAADFAYVSGGSWDEVTLRENVAAFRRRSLRSRVFRDVSSVSTASAMLGAPVALPVGVAPMAMQALAHPEAERAMARGAAEAGAPMIVSTLSSRPLEEIAACRADAPQWFQLYVHRDRGVARELMERAVAAGFTAIVVTGDLPVVAHRDRELRARFRGTPSFGNFPARRDDDGTFAHFIDGLHDQAVTWADLTWVRATSGLPLVVKGVMTGDDARLACEHGASAIVVSNHGGRQLDRSPASIDALEEVVAAVGSRCEVYLDGGVRRGLDVLVALSLGARGVFIGRPAFYALACGGGDAVRDALRQLQREMTLGMALMGVTGVELLTAS